MNSTLSSADAEDAIEAIGNDGNPFIEHSDTNTDYDTAEESDFTEITPTMRILLTVLSTLVSPITTVNQLPPLLSSARLIVFPV